MKQLKKALSLLLALSLLGGLLVGALPAFAAEYTETELNTNGFDYGFKLTTYSEDVSYLDDNFTVYRHTRKPATYDAGNAVATFKPTDTSGSFNAVYTNGNPGFKLDAGVSGTQFSVMTYKTKEYTDFYAEYSLYGYVNGLGLAFGMPLGNAGVINDGNVANDTAVYVRVRETGATVMGAIDTAAAENVNPHVWTTNTMSFGFDNVDFVSTDSIKLTNSNTATATICVEVKDGFVSVWKKGTEATVLKVKLSDAYTGGYVGLFMSNPSGAMYTGFGIRSYDAQTTELDTVYLSATGDDTNAGDSESAAVATLAKATQLVKDGGTIHVVGDYPLTAFAATAKEITYVGGTLDFSGVADEWVHMQGPATFGDITVKFKSGNYVYWVANYHKLVVSADATIIGTPNVFGGKQINDFQSVQSGNTRVELYAGTYLTVGAGNRRGGMSGTSYVKVGGTAKINDLFGGIGADYGQMKGDVKMYIDGGTITNVYGGSSHQGTANSVYIEMNGGTVGSIFGGNKAANMKHMNYSTNSTPAKVEIVLNGGTVTKRVYGGCYNNDSTNYYVYGTTKVTVNDGVTLGGNAWEGMAAGSRAKTNSADETATLDFGTPDTKEAYAQYITTGTNFIDTTDIVLPTTVVYDTVYLSASGSDTNAGDTEDEAVASLAKATELVKDGGTIHVVGDYPLTEFAATTKEITYVGGTLDFSGVADEYVIMQGPATFGDVTLKFKSGNYVYWLANHHKLVVSADATIVGTPNVFGGKQINTFTDTHTGNTHVELYAGTYLTVGGGNRRGGMAGTSYVKVGGTAKITTLYGGTGADYGLMKGDVKIYIDGGAITTVYGGSSHQGTANSVYIEMNGGTVESLFGGNGSGNGVGSNMKHTNYAANGTLAKVDIVLNGGTVTRRLYGGCYNDVSTTNKYKVYGTVTVTVKEGFTFGGHSSWEGVRAGSRTKVTDYESDCAETTTLTIDTLAAYQAVKKYLKGADSSAMQQHAIVNTTDTLQLPEGAENGEITVSAVDNGNGTVTSTITVTPKAGYELQAGTLLAKDADGNLYVPTRKGFRNGGDASQYIVVAASAVTADGVFYKPTAAQPNIGNLGNSVNTAKSGLRFISRINRSLQSDVPYITLDGEQKKILDYGMLLAVEDFVGDDPLTLELHAENTLVQKISVFEKKIYFDYCSDYVDMSICVTNIDAIEGAADFNIKARAYVVYDNGTAQGAVAYADAFASTYNEAAQNKESSMTDLVADGMIATVGRADLVGDTFAMDNVQSGFEFTGTLQGAVKVRFDNEKYETLINVFVDGVMSTVTVPQGTTTVTITPNLAYGEHTIKVVRASAVYEAYTTLSALYLDYNGSLDTQKSADDKLKIEVLGDSITAGYGVDYESGTGLNYNRLAALSNSHYTYAAQAARALNADLSVVAWCSKTLGDISSIYTKTSARSGSTDWNFTGNEADIVIINLGTNDEWQGLGLNKEEYNAENTLAKARTLLATVREKNPRAYIVWVYGMMRKDYEDSVYKAVVAERQAAGDDKVFCVDMSAYKGTGGYNGNHPKRAAHTATATALVDFIKANCNVQVATMADLAAADTVKFNGRTTIEGTARSMHFGNTGITLSGYLYGDMVLNVTKNHSMGHVNIVIDGDYDNVRTVTLQPGDYELVIYEDLAAGNHTVEILYGTSRGKSATLVMKSVTYAGTLTKPADKDLQIEFIGDSITVGEGMWTDYTNSERLDSYNNFYGYAPRTGRALNADITLSAICGYTTKQMREYFNNDTYASGYQQKDIVVINLCTNDVWSLVSSNTANRDAVLTQVTGLLTDVRAAYPDAHIVWAFGSMPVMSGGVDQVARCLDYVKDTVNAFAANDDKVHFCDMTPVKNDEGVSDHPDYDAHIEQSAYLVDFIRTNCADALS